MKTLGRRTFLTISAAAALAASVSTLSLAEDADVTWRLHKVLRPRLAREGDSGHGTVTPGLG